MNFNEDVKPITFLKTKAAALLKQLNSNSKPVIITQNGEARAVLLNFEEYEKQKKNAIIT